MCLARDLLGGKLAENGKPYQGKHCKVHPTCARDQTIIRSVGQWWQGGRVVIVGVIMVVIIVE